MKIHILNCGFIVRNEERYVLLASDAAVSARSWEKMEAPGFAADPALQFKTLRWVAKEANDTAWQPFFAVMIKK